MSTEIRPALNLQRIALERDTGDPAEDNLRRLARSIVRAQKAKKAESEAKFQLARDAALSARAEVDEAWRAQV